jgi:hypothetical protein
MNSTTALSPHLSLTALRGAVGGVVGAEDGGGCWDQLVWLWRIFSALDGLMAVLWALVHRIRADGVKLALVGPAVAEIVRREPSVVTGVRRRAVAGGQAVPGRRVSSAVVALVRPVQWGARVPVDWGPRGRDLAWRAPVLAVRGSRFSKLGMGDAQNCALIVPVR